MPGSVRQRWLRSTTKIFVTCSTTSSLGIQHLLLGVIAPASVGSPEGLTFGTRMQVRLLDFNPIGGTTSPLLFTWQELGYAGCEQSSQAGKKPRAPTTVSGVLTEPDGAVVASPDDLSYRQHAQVSEAASISREIEEQNRTQEGGSCCGAEEGSREECKVQSEAKGDLESLLTERGVRLEAGSSSWEQILGSSSESASSVQNGEGGSRRLEPGNGECHAGLDFRIVLETNRVQPNMPTFGVPFDLVDRSEGGACDELLQKLREVQLLQEREP